MWLRSFLLSMAMVLVATTAHAMTEAEVRARIEAAGYSQIRVMSAGKIRTFKAVRDGRERSIIVDSFGRIREFQ